MTLTYDIIMVATYIDHGLVAMLPGMWHPGPVLGCDQDGGEADRQVAPLQLHAASPPPALDAQGEGRVVALALQVDTQTLETLVLAHRGQQSLSCQWWTTLAGVGDEIVEWCPTVATAVIVTTGAVTNAEAEHEQDEQSHGH